MGVVYTCDQLMALPSRTAPVTSGQRGTLVSQLCLRRRGYHRGCHAGAHCQRRLQAMRSVTSSFPCASTRGEIQVITGRLSRTARYWRCVFVDTSDRYQFTSYNDTIVDATVASRTLLQVYLCRAIVAVNRTIAAVSPGGHAVISTVSVSSSSFILQLRGRVSAVCAEN